MVSLMDYPLLVFAGSLVVFFLAQRYFVQGMNLGAVKE